ncbi:hypothetical protein [Nocardia sp. NPDC005366]|uniref:hypothetical protein n=1 Tax=Nocardia sp. NPDC005366 TaxID=3156878 RepID=UPI0033AE4207
MVVGDEGGSVVGAINVGVVGFRWGCWKCSETVQCVVGPYRYGDKLIPLGDPAMLIAREILNQVGKSDIAELLVPSRYANGTRGELASHCASCGVVQGNYYVQQRALESLVESDGNIEILDLLADGSYDEAAWSELVSDEYSSVIYF